MMTIIYAKGEPRFFEFGLASNQQQLPSGAVVLAIADGDHVAEHLDEHIFARMTDEEYYQLQGLINNTREPKSISH